MKVWKAIIASSLVSIFVVNQVEAKPGGKGGGKPGDGDGDPPPLTSCADKPSTFPAFAYTVQITDRKGGTVGWEFYLSNADADCEVKIHSTEYNRNNLEISYSQNGDNGVIAFRLSNKENAGRKDVDANFDRIKLLRFQTSDKEVISSLPLSSSTVAATDADSNSFRYIDLSADGNKIAVSVGNNDLGYTINSISEIDISSCSENCVISTPLLVSDEHITIGLAYSSFMDRIYYTGKYRNSSTDDLVGQYYVAFIEKQESSWSAPRYITLSGNGLHGNTSYFRQPDVAIIDLGNGPTEVLAFHRSDYNGDGSYTTQIIDVGSCTAAGDSDCLSTGESSIIKDLPGSQECSFDNKFNAKSLLVTEADRAENGNIVEYNIISDSTVYLTSGFQADSGF